MKYIHRIRDRTATRIIDLAIVETSESQTFVIHATKLQCPRTFGDEAVLVQCLCDFRGWGGGRAALRTLSARGVGAVAAVPPTPCSQDRQGRGSSGRFVPAANAGFESFISRSRALVAPASVPSSGHGKPESLARRVLANRLPYWEGTQVTTVGSARACRFSAISFQDAGMFL